MVGGIESGSFRDPSGQIINKDGRIYRTVTASAVDDFKWVKDTGLLDTLVADGALVPFEEADSSLVEELAAEPALLLEHPRLPFISYPYEWPFNALKAAALHHLDIHLRALDHNVTMSDASAYNIQFRGSEPIFIDHLSFVPLRDGGLWHGHRQFCEQFLNPLLLRSYLDVPHNAWYRGNLEGIPIDQLRRVLPFQRKFSLNVLMHVTLQARFQRNFSDSCSAEKIKAVNNVNLPVSTLRRMLRKLSAWIEKLQPPGGKTEWSDYADGNSYNDEGTTAKRDFIKNFVTDTKPLTLWDLGCNTGDYSVAALDAGAEYVVGFDVDQGALEKGFVRAQHDKLNLLLLHFDASNPSPEQGWSQAERRGMSERGPADGLLALALVHHLAISCNVPLARIASWLANLAYGGVVEFVPKSDPMVKRLLRLRQDIFLDYNEEYFLQALSNVAEIQQIAAVPNSGRKLIRYRSKPNLPGDH
ncbi:MAG: class I SAM-dependent methyltransferase [Pseudomonadota bacterium]|nr:class I SAM-dependent methyltransferase [Pseudomonadota bacterium]